MPQILDVEDDDGELVAAEPRDGIDLADGILEARGRLLDQLVAARMAERVVDGLEAVEVDIEQADLPVGARDGKQRALQPVLEQRAVGQAGQRVVEGEILRMALAALQRARGAAQAPEQEPEHAGGKQAETDERRAGLPDQGEAGAVGVPGDVAEDDAVRVHQRDGGRAGAVSCGRQTRPEAGMPRDAVDDRASTNWTETWTYSAPGS